MDYRLELRKLHIRISKLEKYIHDNFMSTEFKDPEKKAKESPPPVKEVSELKIYYCRKCGRDYELCGGCKAHM